jgi:hypothetical protein
MGLKEFKTVLAEELAKDQSAETKEKALGLIAWSGVIGSIVWGAVAVAAAIMLVGFGAWPWVVWPLAFYWWTQHVGRVIQVYTKAKKPEAKWEQNVVVNVTATSEMTAEQISEAASRAVNERLTYGL